MAWGAIGLNQAVGPVVFQNLGLGRGGGITAAHYIDQALRHIVPYFAHHRNHVFLHDNVRTNTTRATKNFLHRKGVNTMQWPALVFSLDRNPIVHP